MAMTVLLVGTRKGCFLLESDESRRDWSVRGPFCEGWPIYHAVHDPATGTIYAAAASEWHGASVWRASDLGETWEQSSEGLSYDDGNGLKLSKVSGLTAAHGRLLAGAESAGIFESRDGGVTWSLLSTLDGQPGRDSWNDPANQPPGHLGLPAILPHPDEPSRFWAVDAGLRHLRDDRRRRLVDAAQQGAARGLAARGPGGRLLRPQARHVAATRSASTSRTTSACTAATTPGSRGSRSPRACRPSSGSAPPRIPTTATRSTSSRSTPATGAACPRVGPRSGARATRARAGSGSTTASRSATRISACCAKASRSTRTTCPGLYFGTSTGQVFASADEGESWSEIASYLPAISSVEVAVLD